MISENGWICEARDAPAQSWMSDAPWFKSNEATCHRWLYGHAGGVHHMVDSLELVKGTDLQRQVFYGNPIAHPGEMVGLAARFNTLDRNEAQSAANVIDATGAGPRLVSAYLVVWGRRSIYMVTPTGIPHSIGIGPVALIVEDFRYAVRIANIDPMSNIDLESLFNRALVRLPSFPRDEEKMRAVFYLGPQLSRRSDIARLGGRHRGIALREIAVLGDEDRVGGKAEAVA